MVFVAFQNKERCRVHFPPTLSRMFAKAFDTISWQFPNVCVALRSSSTS